MRSVAALALTLLFAPAVLARPVTDDAGRKVEIPNKIDRVAPAGPPASALLAMLLPERTTGWVRPLYPDEAALLPPNLAQLPVGKPAGASLYLDYGNLQTRYVERAQSLQQSVETPVVVFDGRLTQLPAVLRRLGPLLGAKPRAEQLAADAARRLAQTQAIVAKLDRSTSPRVYVARGPDGLSSVGADSLHGEVVKLVGAKNVVPGDDETVKFDRERLVAAAPDVILALRADTAEKLRADPALAQVPAIRNGRVHVVPNAPFSWIETATPQRLLGLSWLGQLLYPDRFKLDLKQEAKSFLALWWGAAPDDAALDATLLSGR